METFDIELSALQLHYTVMVRFDGTPGKSDQNWLEKNILLIFHSKQLQNSNHSLK